MELKNFFKSFKLIYLFTLEFLFISSVASGGVNTDLNPVVLFPGLGGSRLEIRAEEAYSCRDQKRMNNYEPLWLNFGYLLPTSFNCFMDRIKLVCSMDSDYQVPQKGIYVRAAHFGKTESVEFLHSYMKFGPGSYMHTLVNQLVQKGLVRDVSIRAAPYDFRLGLSQLDEYFEQVKDLIEETYRTNGFKRVILMCHSLGCLRSVHFLNNQTQSWKNKYVHEYVTLSAPWGGSVKSLLAQLIGQKLGLPLLDAKKMRELQRTYPSITELLPNPEIFNDKPLVRTPSREYDSTEYGKLFQSAACDVCLFNYLKLVEPNIRFPRVNTTCMHGIGVSTPSGIRFLENNFDGKFELDKDDGDGTVNSESLSFCQGWNKKRDHFTFSYVTLFGSTHEDVVKNTRTVEKILKYIF